MNRKYSLGIRTKIYTFYFVNFFALFLGAVFINFFIFNKYLEDSEFTKAQMIAESIALNVAPHIKQDLNKSVRAEILRQMDKNTNITQVEIKDKAFFGQTSIGYTRGRQTFRDDNFVIDGEIWDSLRVEKLGSVRVYYSKQEFLNTKFFVSGSLFLFFTAMAIIGIAWMLLINSYFTPVLMMTQKLNAFEPNLRTILPEITNKNDEISLLQNSVYSAIKKTLLHLESHLNENEALKEIVQESVSSLGDYEELLGAITELSPDAILFVNDGVLYANNAFLALTGYAAEELFQKKVYTLFGANKNSDFIKALDVRLAADVNINMFEEILLNKKDGSSCFVTVSVAYPILKNSSIIVLNLVDLTVLKQKDQMLLVQSRFVAMGEMIANIAHQWRQPLNVIQSSITKVSIYKEMGTITDKFLDDTVSNVKKQVNYLSSTIDDFRNFYKDDPEGSFFLSDAIKKALSLVEAAYQNSFIDVELEYAGCENISIKGSINRLIQAFLNILNNTKDALIGSKELDRVAVIYCKKRGNTIVLYMQDSGGGIEPKNMDIIFDPYFSTKNKTQGSGIGLYMTKQIIESSFGGRIEANNVEFIRNNIKLRGACFTIELPLIA